MKVFVILLKWIRYFSNFTTCEMVFTSGEHSDHTWQPAWQPGKQYGDLPLCPKVQK